MAENFSMMKTLAIVTGVLLVGGVVFYSLFLAKPPDRLAAIKEYSVAQGAAGQDKAAKSPPLTPERVPEIPSGESDETIPTPAKKIDANKKKAAAGPASPKAPMPQKKLIVATNEEPIAVSVNRIFRRQAEDPKAAHLEYDSKLLEIRGIYQKSTPTPGGLNVVFATDARTEVTWKVGPDSIAAALKNVSPGQQLTLRGVCEAPLNLHQTEVVRIQSMGDETYQDKLVDLAGFVGQVGAVPGQEFTSLRFEPDTTNGALVVECWFKKQQRHQLDGFTPGQFVVVRGKCGGLSFNTVRIHNCEVLYDYSPKRDIARLDVGRFILEYEQDLREQETSDSSEFVPVAAALLLNHFKDPANGSKQFVRRWLEVDGALESVDPLRSAVVLEGGTDQRLKVRCLFSLAKYRKLKTAPTMKIRGYCSGLDGEFVRLDNCDAIQPAPMPDKQGLRLDAEFLPFRAGETLVYDTGFVFGQSAKTALRQSLTFAENRTIEIAGTHLGELKKATGLGGGVHWTKKSPAVKPLQLQYRWHAGRVEINHAAGGEGNPAIGDWEPVLAMGAQAGDSWTWNHRGQKIVYTLDEFSMWDFQQSAVIRKTVESKKPAALSETVHVYARGVGEVERKQFELLSKGPKRLVMETKLVK